MFTSRRFPILILALLGPALLSACNKPAVVATYDDFRSRFGVSDAYARDEEHLLGTGANTCRNVNPFQGAYVDTALSKDMDYFGALAAEMATMCPDKAQVFLSAQAALVSDQPAVAARIAAMKAALPAR